MAGGFVMERLDLSTPLGKVPVVVLATHETDVGNLAAVVVPVTVHVEMNGTFTNGKGVAQSFKRAISPPPGVRPAWETIVELARKMDASGFASSLDDVRKALPQQAQEARA